MRIGVTGASGFIGQALASSLHDRGDTVVRFVRADSPRTAGPAIRWDPSRGLVDDGDLRDAGRLDALINLAGAGIGDRRWSAQRREVILSSRVQSTALLVQVARRSGGVAAVVSASAIGWYGDRGDQRLDESSTGGEGFLADVCRAWEDATRPLEDDGVAVAHVRSGIVISSHGGALARQLPMFRAGLGAKLGAGRQWMSPIALSDEVRAIEWLLDHQLSGPFNLVGPQPIPNSDFTRLLAAHLHRPSFLRVPVPALRLALGKEMAEELLLTSQRVEPRRLLESGFGFVSPDVASALAREL